MKQFTMTLSKRLQRPVVKLENFFNIYAMIDTGALFPVWNYKEEILTMIGGVKIASNAGFRGFGGKTFGNIYRIPNFRVGDLIFPQFHIVANRDNLPCHMLLSATVFNNLIYEIDNFHHKLNVTIPDSESVSRNLVITDSNGILHVACTSSEF